MTKTLRLLLAAIATIGIIGAAFAQTNNIFFTSKGDLTFPFGNPKADGSAGTIGDNMTIGASKARAGTFTTVTAATIAGAATVDSVCATFLAPGAAMALDSAFFVAPKALTVTSVRAVWGVIAGAAFTANPMKATGTQAPASGVALTTAAFDLNTTANTVGTGTLSATPANLALAVGNRLAIDFTGTPTNIAGLAITVCMQ